MMTTPTIKTLTAEIARRQQQRDDASADGGAARLEIRTDDAAWAAKYGTPGRAGRTVVEVPAHKQATFAGADMVSFHMLTVAPVLPRDCANANAMVPAAWVIG